MCPSFWLVLYFLIFAPLDQVDPKVISLKMESAKCVSHIHALSVNPSCMQFLQCEANFFFFWNQILHLPLAASSSSHLALPSDISLAANSGVTIRHSEILKCSWKRTFGYECNSSSLIVWVTFLTRPPSLCRVRKRLGYQDRIGDIVSHLTWILLLGDSVRESVP